MAAATTTSRAPDARFLVAHPAHFLALGFGSGLAPVAPGTFGTLAGLGIYWLLAAWMPPILVALLAVPLFFVGTWACGVTGRALGVMDHGAMVLDEIVAFLPLAALAHVIASQLAPGDALWRFAWQLGAFLLFRLFDIWKPFPIRHFERRLKGGFGVMFDDLVAAAYAYTVLLLAAIAWYRMTR